MTDDTSKIDADSLKSLGGPFVVADVDKDADDEQVKRQLDAVCQRINDHSTVWRREDIYWAHEEITNYDQRLAADANSPNLDLGSGELRRLARIYHLDGPPGWEPIDPEPPVELASTINLDSRTVADSVGEPEVLLDLPIINRWLQQFASALDPWEVE